MEPIKYIAIEGPIGVGKTSLARGLAEEFKGRLVLENAEHNPFIKDFYRDRKAHAFETQMYFLLTRFKQQIELRQADIFERYVVSVYFFAKDLIFANINLTADELDIHRQVYEILKPRLPRPDLVIYLHARTEVLMERIKRRNTSYEQDLDMDYMHKLVEAYNDYFFYHSSTPLLVINTSDIDFVKNKTDFMELVKEIRGAKKGTWHYIPLGSR